MDLSDSLYLVFTWFGIGSTFGVGLCIMFLAVSGKPELAKYRRACKYLAAAYLTLSAVNALEILTRSDTPDMPLTWTLTLLITAVQSILFTFSAIVLINPAFPTKRRALREIIPVAALSTVQFVMLFLPGRIGFQPVFYIFIAYCALMFARFVLIFLKNYRQYLVKVDNFYSEEKAACQRWIKVAFFMALATGIGALSLTFTGNSLYFCLYTIMYVSFYSWFGIKFINYSQIFDKIEQVIREEPVTRGPSPPEHEHERDLTGKMEQWVAAKKYTQKGITIRQMATDIHTNRKYLSEHINNVEHMTFRDYINSLRIAEACRLLEKNPSATLSSIANATGFSDKSNFSKVFLKLTGCNFSEYRKIY
jgi:AraC-like DNA-binding protein